MTTMRQRTPLLVLAALAVLGLSWGGVRTAFSKQDAERRQTIAIGYPTTGIATGGNDERGRPRRYLGIVYVRVTPVGADLVRKYGAGPMVTAELSASRRTVNQLPVGEYEVSFGMRTGSEMKTFVVRDVLLRPDAPSSLIVEMNGEAQTTIVGGDMTARQMADGIRGLQAEVTALKQEVAKLKERVK